MFTRNRRLRCGALLLSLAVALCALSTALASAHFEHSIPRRSEVVPVSPASVQLFTDAELAAGDENVIQVQSANSLRVDINDTQIDPQNPRRASVSLQKNLSAGRYLVSYVTVSAVDGEKDRGQFSFYVTGQPTSQDRKADNTLRLTSEASPPTARSTSNNAALLGLSAVAAAVILAGGLGTFLLLRPSHRDRLGP